MRNVHNRIPVNVLVMFTFWTHHCLMSQSHVGTQVSDDSHLLSYRRSQLRRPRDKKHKASDVLCNSQEIIAIHKLILAHFLVRTYPTSVDHDVALWISFGIQKVVTFGAEVKGGLCAQV